MKNKDLKTIFMQRAFEVFSEVPSSGGVATTGEMLMLPPYVENIQDIVGLQVPLPWKKKKKKGPAVFTEGLQLCR